MTMGRSLCFAAMTVCAAALLGTACFHTGNENKTKAAMVAAYRMNMPDIPSDLSLITDSQINNAKSRLHIAYGHTSHGSQLDHRYGRHCRI